MPDAISWRMTALSYLLLFIIGVTISLAGVATKEIAQSFAVDTYVIGYIFALFTIGYSLAIFGNGFIIDKVDLKKETLTVLTLAGIGVTGATLTQSAYIFAVAIFLDGLGLGVLLSVAFFLITNLYDEPVRAGKISMLNFAYSIGAIIAPFLAGVALGTGYSWKTLYQATLLLLLAAALVAATLQLKVKRRSNRPDGPEDVWGIRIYLVGLMLLCYVLSEMIFTYWIVLYLRDNLNFAVAVASGSLSVFWVFMALGRLLAGLYIERICLGWLILVSSAVAFTTFVLLLGVNNHWMAMGLIASMGCGYSSLYSSILSYGTSQVSCPSSKLTTFYLTIGSAGGILSFILSSFIEQNFNVTIALATAAACMGGVTVLTAVAERESKK